MPTKPHLFAVTRWLLNAASLVAIFFLAILTLALGAVLVAITNLDGHHLGIPATLQGVARGDALTIGGFAIAVGLVCIVLVFCAIRLTTRIIETAISGDPFVNENATRLTQIGWLLLGVEIVGLLTQPLFNSLITQLVPENVLQEATFHAGSGASPVGLLAVLLIFALAQIFRRGSDMRAELEATV